MKFFNAAMNMAIQAKKEAKKTWLLHKGAGLNVDYKELYDLEVANQMDTFAKALAICDDMQKIVGVDNYFAITIAPIHSCDFVDFYTLCEKFVTSKMFLHYVYAFEQKGTTLETLGQHAHCHFVVATTYAKSHVLKRCHTIFDAVCGNSGIQVDKAKRPEAFINKYLIEHTGREDTSDPKSATTQMDTLWRANLNLNPIYLSPNANEIWNINVDVTKSVNIDDSNE